MSSFFIVVMASSANQVRTNYFIAIYPQVRTRFFFCFYDILVAELENFFVNVSRLCLIKKILNFTFRGNLKQIGNVEKEKLWLFSNIQLAVTRSCLEIFYRASLSLT